MVHTRGQTWMEFGKGDVDLFVSYDDKHSLVIMENTTEPRVIGVWKETPNKDMDADRFQKAPAVMSFENIESIDALIYSLTKAKEAFYLFCSSEAVAE